MVPRWYIFDDFLRPVFAASRVQHVSDLHLKFARRPHHVWQTSNLRRLRLGEEKKKDRKKKKKLQNENIMVCPWQWHSFFLTHSTDGCLLTDACIG